ncbi:MAG: hypothetical protein Q9164_007770, partial [Protoblastenia rupestris]
VLNSLPQETHWFCPGNRPKRLNEAGCIKADYNDTSSVNDASDVNAPSSAQKRIEIFYQALPILGFDSPDAIGLQNGLKEGIVKQVARCSRCIYRYYESRPPFVRQLQ